MREIKGMTCPRCRAALTDSEARSIWASYCGKRQSPHGGPGRPPGSKALATAQEGLRNRLTATKKRRAKKDEQGRVGPNRRPGRPKGSKNRTKEERLASANEQTILTRLKNPA